MTSAIMLIHSGFPDQEMLEVRILFTEARVLNSVHYNKHWQVYRLKCQQWTRLSGSSKHAKLNKSTGQLLNDALQSLSLKKFHLKVLKNVRALIMLWEHGATRQSFQPAASRKSTPLKGLLSLQSNSARITTDHNSQTLELFTDDAKCIKAFSLWKHKCIRQLLDSHLLQLWPGPYSTENFTASMNVRINE